MAASMRSARLHEPGQPLRIDTVEIPEPRPRDVLVQVKACGIIPNMNAIFSGRLWNHLPPLPASVGLDAAGVIAKVGSEVTEVAVGDRVYVNPWLSCGMCSYCRAGEPMLCSAAAFQGYFGFFPHSTRQLLDYPFGGFSEYITASPQRLVHLPPQVTFEQAARFGYLGTSFAARVLAGYAAAAGLRSTGLPARSGSAPRYSPLQWGRRAFSDLAAIVTCLRN
jgi:D-arabinose 1-dehydrogenase-like Zn-dependent alcohol dehydrogenase